MAGKTKGTHPGTEIARQAFLYQGVSEIKELAELSGKAECTIRGHMEKWVAEREETLKKANPLVPVGSLSLPAEVSENHDKDVAFLRSRLDKTKSELEALPSMIEDVKEIVEKFIVDEQYFDKALALFDRMLRLWANEKAMTKLFLDLKNTWDAKSGVDVMKNIQESTAKAVAVAQAKSQDPDPSPKESNVVPSGVFRKRLD